MDEKVINQNGEPDGAVHIDGQWLSMCSYNFIHATTGWNHCTHPLQEVHQQ